MRINLLLALLLSCTIACQSGSEQASDTAVNESSTATSFDSEKWQLKEGKDYPYRESMTHYVLYDETFRTLKKAEILELLGAPDRENEGHLYYMISQKRLGLWPLSTKTLVIKLTDDFSIEWIKMHG